MKPKKVQIVHSDDPKVTLEIRKGKREVIRKENEVKTKKGGRKRKEGGRLRLMKEEGERREGKRVREE